MAKAVPTRHQLNAAVPLIYREMGQLFAYATWFMEVRPVIAAVFPEKSRQYVMVQDSIVIATVLALRKLNEFFRKRPSNDDERDDDLRAYDYPGFTKTGDLLLPEDFREIHKRIGHMTYREVDTGKASYELYEAVARVLPRCIEFLDHIRGTICLDQQQRDDIGKVRDGLMTFWSSWETAKQAGAAI